MKKAIRLLKITLLLFSITGLPFVAIAITQKPAAGQKTSPPPLPAKNQVPTRTDSKPSINGAYKGEAQDYAAVKFSRSLRKNLTPAKPAPINKVGCAFLGKVGAANMARAPWGWFDSSERARPLGEWFFSPAATVKRHFKPGDAFSVAYTHNPYFSVFR